MTGRTIHVGLARSLALTLCASRRLNVLDEHSCAEREFDSAASPTILGETSDYETYARSWKMRRFLFLCLGMVMKSVSVHTLKAISRIVAY